MTVALLILATLLFPFPCFAQSGGNETISFTTYYPSPYGVYRNLRLFPSPQPETNSAQQAGTMYFNETENSVYVYRNAPAGWVKMGGDGYWQMNGTNLTTVNPANLKVAGTINATSDLCINGIGCLAQMLSNQPLVNSAHSRPACTAAGGTVLDIGASYPICRFNAAACPAGWTRYDNWTATAPAKYSNTACGVICSNVTTGSHPWSNSAIEFVNYWSCAGCICNPQGCTVTTGYAAVGQIGCY